MSADKESASNPPIERTQEFLNTRERIGKTIHVPPDIRETWDDLLWAEVESEVCIELNREVPFTLTKKDDIEIANKVAAMRTQMLSITRGWRLALIASEVTRRLAWIGCKPLGQPR